MVKLDVIHFGANQLRQTVCRRRRRVGSAESESGDVFVNLLRNKRDMEEELFTRKSAIASLRRRRRVPRLFLQETDSSSSRYSIDPRE